ncbi:hypothetical protein NEOKW01_1137 [Nematocida sp. AWRm80]|nr:hypothetical protein NEOKW01_1137 [Nematocida sp. AWRm80]
MVIKASVIVLKDSIKEYLEYLGSISMTDSLRVLGIPENTPLDRYQIDNKYQLIKKKNLEGLSDTKYILEKINSAYSVLNGILEDRMLLKKIEKKSPRLDSFIN